MANIKLGNDTLTGVDTIKVTNADDETQKVDFKAGNGYKVTFPSSVSVSDWTRINVIKSDGTKVALNQVSGQTINNVVSILAYTQGSNRDWTIIGDKNIIAMAGTLDYLLFGNSLSAPQGWLGDISFIFTADTILSTCSFVY